MATPASVALANREAADRARSAGDYRRAFEHDALATRLEALAARHA